MHILKRTEDQVTSIPILFFRIRLHVFEFRPACWAKVLNAFKTLPQNFFRTCAIATPPRLFTWQQHGLVVITWLYNLVKHLCQISNLWKWELKTYLFEPITFSTKLFLSKVNIECFLVLFLSEQTHTATAVATGLEWLWGFQQDWQTPVSQVFQCPHGVYTVSLSGTSITAESTKRSN